MENAKKSLVWISLLSTVVLVGCFHKPSNLTPPPDTLSWDITATGTVENNSAFDPKNFDDKEVKEVFNLLEELVNEDEWVSGDVKTGTAEAGANANMPTDTNPQPGQTP